MKPVQQRGGAKRERNSNNFRSPTVVPSPILPPLQGRPSVRSQSVPPQSVGVSHLLQIARKHVEQVSHVTNRDHQQQIHHESPVGSAVILPAIVKSSPPLARWEEDDHGKMADPVVSCTSGVPEGCRRALFPAASPTHTHVLFQEEEMRVRREDGTPPSEESPVWSGHLRPAGLRVRNSLEMDQLCSMSLLEPHALQMAAEQAAFPFDSKCSFPATAAYLRLVGFGESRGEERRYAESGSVFSMKSSFVSPTYGGVTPMMLERLISPLAGVLSREAGESGSNNLSPFHNWRRFSSSLNSTVTTTSPRASPAHQKQSRSKLRKPPTATIVTLETAGERATPQPVEVDDVSGLPKRLIRMGASIEDTTQRRRFVKKLVASRKKKLTMAQLLRARPQSAGRSTYVRLQMKDGAAPVTTEELQHLLSTRSAQIDARMMRPRPDEDYALLKYSSSVPPEFVKEAVQTIIYSCTVGSLCGRVASVTKVKSVTRTFVLGVESPRVYDALVDEGGEVAIPLSKMLQPKEHHFSRASTPHAKMTTTATTTPTSSPRRPLSRSTKGNSEANEPTATTSDEETEEEETSEESDSEEKRLANAPQRPAEDEDDSESSGSEGSGGFVPPTVEERLEMLFNRHVDGRMPRPQRIVDYLAHDAQHEVMKACSTCVYARPIIHCSTCGLLFCKSCFVFVHKGFEATHQHVLLSSVTKQAAEERFSTALQEERDRAAQREKQERMEYDEAQRRNQKVAYNLLQNPAVTLTQAAERAGLVDFAEVKARQRPEATPISAFASSFKMTPNADSFSKPRSSSHSHRKGSLTSTPSLNSSHKESVVLAQSLSGQPGAQPSPPAVPSLVGPMEAILIPKDEKSPEQATLISTVPKQQQEESEAHKAAPQSAASGSVSAEPVVVPPEDKGPPVFDIKMVEELDDQELEAEREAEKFRQETIEQQRNLRRLEFEKRQEEHQQQLALEQRLRLEELRRKEERDTRAKRAKARFATSVDFSDDGNQESAVIAVESEFSLFVKRLITARQVAVIVSVASYADVTIASLPRLREEANSLERELQKLGYVVELMEDTNKNEFMKPKVANVHTLVKALIASMNNTQQLLVFVRSCGAMGRLPFTSETVPLAMAEDTAANSRDANAFLSPARLMACRPGDEGPGLSVLMDVSPLDAAPFALDHPPSGFAFVGYDLVMDPAFPPKQRGSFVYSYPEGCGGGLMLYFLLRGMRGRLVPTQPGSSKAGVPVPVRANDVAKFLLTRLSKAHTKPVEGMCTSPLSPCSDALPPTSPSTQDSPSQRQKKKKGGKTDDDGAPKLLPTSSCVVFAVPRLDVKKCKVEENKSNCRLNVELRVRIEPPAPVPFVRECPYAWSRWMVDRLQRFIDGEQPRPRNPRIRHAATFEGTRIVELDAGDTSSIDNELAKKDQIEQTMMMLYGKMRKVCPENSKCAIRARFASGLVEVLTPNAAARNVATDISAMHGMPKRPAAIWTRVIVSLHGCQRDMRRLQKLCALQPLKQTVQILSVTQDACAPKEHEQAVRIQATYRGYRLRHFLRLLREVESNEATERAAAESEAMEYVSSASSRCFQGMVDMVISDEEEQRATIVEHELQLRQQKADVQSLVLLTREEMQRRSISEDSEHELFGLQELFVRHCKMAAQRMTFELLMRCHANCFRELWFRYYVVLEEYCGRLAIRNNAHNVLSELPPVPALESPPTGFDYASTLISIPIALRNHFEALTAHKP